MLRGRPAAACIFHLTVYEYGGDIIVVDCGMGFPDDDMYGIDVVIPDVTYLIKNQNKIRGPAAACIFQPAAGAVTEPSGRTEHNKLL